MKKKIQQLNYKVFHNPSNSIRTVPVYKAPPWNIDFPRRADDIRYLL